MSVKACFQQLYSGYANRDCIEAVGTILAEVVIAASLLIHTNVFGFTLAPLMLIAFVCLIVAVCIASKKHEETSGNTWTWLALAAVAQILTFMALAK